MTGHSLRAAISTACDLTNPRLSEVDWDEVAAAFNRLRSDPQPDSQTTTPRPEALTAEEERELRRELDFGGQLSSVPALWLRVRRLVATLDAARAARPETGLREAAQRVIEVVDEPSPQDDGRWHAWEQRHLAAVEALRAALSATPPADAPLDVDWFVREVVAYYKQFDHHEVWRESGARALGKWLAARLTDGDG